MRAFKKLSNITLLLMIFSLLNLPVGASASTSVSGNISSNIWTAEDSPYVIDGTVEIAAGAKLTINPGAVIRFNQGGKLVVKGRLEAVGEAGNMIVFTSNETNPARGDWTGIEFLDESVNASFNDNDEYVSGNIIKYAVIKYSEGIKCDDASPFLSDNLILNNETGINIIGDKATGGGEVLLGENGKNNSAEVEPIIISNNEITDNNIGILVNRKNSNSYVATPAGKAWQGDTVITANLKNNTITNNNQGVVVSRGDNNIIYGNQVNNNFSEGLLIGLNSMNNVVEKNTLNNNETGLYIKGESAKAWRNTIKYNFANGLSLSGSDSYVRNNNIYNNYGKNLDNKFGSVDLSQNYWGSASLSQIKAGVNDESDLTTFEPFKTGVINTDELMAPSLNAVVSPTISTEQTISGMKTIGTAVIVNGSQVSEYDNQVDWQYKMPLVLGENKATVTLMDKNGNRSSSVVTIITRTKEIIVESPTIDSFSSQTTRGSQTISGTKKSGTAILINNGIAVSANGSTTWSYELPLSKGANVFSILAQDSEGRQSQSVTVTITRKEIDVSGIVSEEKELTTQIDNKLALRVAGRLLLQVERDGLIWYVNPIDSKRYYVTQENALEIFRKLSLGITESDLEKIPLAGSGKMGDNALRNRLKGRFMLRVEKAGAISYIDIDGYRHEVTMSNVMNLFRSLSLGITNNDLRKIEVGELD